MGCGQHPAFLVPSSSFKREMKPQGSGVIRREDAGAWASSSAAG
jgi:hypothetical protein